MAALALFAVRGRAHAQAPAPEVRAAAPHHGITVPLMFDVGTCLLEIDRSRGDTLELPYDVPLPDPPPPDPLVPDTPAHQIFALCRTTPVDVGLPPWIDDDDVMLALDAGLLTQPPAADQVLATASDWRAGHDGADGTCVWPLITKDARRPMTCDAITPVTWDPAGVPAGGYILAGYTFDPDSNNAWRVRAGAVWIHDGDPAMAPPVAMLQFPLPGSNRILYDGDTFPLRGCAAGMAGTEVELAWARVGDADTWTPIATVPVEPGACDFEVPFTPPPEAVGQSLLLRAQARDPEGRTFDGYAQGSLVVFPSHDTPSSPPSLPPFDGACGVAPAAPSESASCHQGGTEGTTGASGSTGAGSGTGATSGATGPAAAGDTAGCACHAPDPGPRRMPPLALLLVPALARRPRPA